MHEVSIEPDYFQFYVRRHGAAWASDAVPQEGYRDRLWTDGGFVVVGTYRKFEAMPVRVEVLDADPGPPEAGWQHVAEVSLGSGGPVELFHWGVDDPALTIDAPTEPLRLRAHWQGLVPGRFEGLDDDGRSDERVLLQLWPSVLGPPGVLRRWEGWPL